MKNVPHNPLAFLPWLLGAYIATALLCEWTGISNQPSALALLSPISEIIPSIQSYTVLSPNRDKAVFEISLAWLFSLALPVLMLRAVDWETVNQSAARLGGMLRAGLFFLAASGFLLTLMTYPITPSDSRRFSRVIAYFYKSDMAFIWGAGIAALAGVALLFFAVGIIQLYKFFINQGDSK
ncbi:MAG TPA: hypothetical protein PL023_00590 [Thiobacillus sp.]|nr:hypothetical protein [Thiobacillus sp.]